MQWIDSCKSNFNVFSRLQICQINKSSVMRQKGKTGVTRKQSTANFPKNEYCVSGVKNARFLEDLAFST